MGPPRRAIRLMAVEPYNIGMTVGADVSPLNRAMDRAKQAVGGFRDGASTALKVTGAAFAAATAAAGTFSVIIARIYSNQSKVIDSLAKTADALGLTTQELQAFNLAADRNGIASDQMAAAILRVQRRLGEAQNGARGATETFDRLGLSVRELARQSSADQITAVARALSQVENQAERAALASQLFGREGAKMVRLMGSLSGGIGDTVSELESLGLTITRVDAAKVEEANDAFAMTRKIIEGVYSTLTIKLAPFVTELSNRFIEFARESGGFGPIVERAIESTIRAMARLADVVAFVHRVFKGVEVVALGVAYAVTAAMDAVAKSVRRISEDALANIRSVAQVMARLPAAGGAVGQALLLATSVSFADVASSADGLGEALARANAELYEMANAPRWSAQVEDFLADVEKRAQESAERVARDGPVNALFEFDDERAEVFRQKFAGIFDLGDDDPFATQQELFELHWEKMNQIAVDGAGGVAREIANRFGIAAGATATHMQSIFDSFSQHSRKMFEANRAWGISDAIVSTAQGVAAGLRLGWPRSVPAVAYAASQGAAQISRIRSTRFGGGGGVGAVGSGMAAPQQQPQEPQRHHISVSTVGGGQHVTVDDAISMARQMAEASKLGIISGFEHVRA